MDQTNFDKIKALHEQYNKVINNLIEKNVGKDPVKIQFEYNKIVESLLNSKK